MRWLLRSISIAQAALCPTLLPLRLPHRTVSRRVPQREGDERSTATHVNVVSEEIGAATMPRTSAATPSSPMYASETLVREG